MMEDLLVYQEELLEKLKKAEKNFKKTPKDRIKRPYLETRLELLEELWKEFKDGHKNIIFNLTNEEEKKHKYFGEDIYDQFEEIYIQYKSNLKEFLQPFLHLSSDLESSSTVREVQKSFNSEIKLPTIQLPTFNGKYEEWQTFYDLFFSIIHNNKCLSPVQKLHYLKSNLSGEPQALLRNYTTTDANYEEAWNELVSRYNNKRFNCNAIMRVLISQRPIFSESAHLIKQLVDTTSTCLKSLNNIEVNTESWDIIINYLVVSKLDTESMKQWEQHLSTKSYEMPTWAQLKHFLECRFRSLEMIDNNKVRSMQPKIKTYHSLYEDIKKHEIKCVKCNGEHYIHNCKQFSLLTPKERQEFVQHNKLCFNCLMPTHVVMKCRQPVSCRRCGRRHHTLLHFDKVTTAKANPPSKSYLSEFQLQPNTSEETNVVVNFSKKNFDNVLLATAKVKACSKNNCKHIIRALIDQGSQASFVTEATVQLLGLCRQPVDGWVSGLGDGRTKIKYMVSFSIQSCHNSNNLVHINAFVLSNLTSALPTTDLDPPEWFEISNLPLADNSFTASGKIDVLLGAEVYSEILLDGMIRHPSRNIIAQNTLFGWILSGQVSCNSKFTSNILSTHIQINKGDELLKQFWEMENEPNALEREFTKNERKCEEFYNKTTIRDSEGRYVVRLPFSSGDPQCKHGNTKKKALRKVQFLERRLSKEPSLKKEYMQVMQEYLTLNHMVSVQNENESEGFYLPHHCVVREDKTTTKVRVVFDASSKGDDNISLNDELLVGPKLQQDLRHMLMRWRIHKIVLIADIVKMYRMVRVAEEDTEYQKLVWRFNPDQPYQTYKLLRLTFGTACAPYLAVKTIQRLAEDEESKYPIAAKITKLDFYMDDMLTGCESYEEAIVIYEQMNNLMNSGGFNLQKWNCNDRKVLTYICDRDDEKIKEDITMKINNVIKVLGVGWNREDDSFEYIVKLPENTNYTKRQVLSDVSRLYDPLGWIAPVIIKAKVVIQKLWKLNLDWDTALTENLVEEWRSYRNSLADLITLKIPRWFNSNKISNIELHTFSDASKIAYAAAVYIRVTDEIGQVHIHLVTAKSKVSPIKEVTIPRLELCGAVLAAKLVFEVSQIMNVPKQNVYGWTDSTIVLAWLMGGSSRWSTFVNNRVSTILNILDFDHWGHVNSETNPADCASRGLSPKDLISHSLWWSGPTWLIEGNMSKINIEDTNEEKKAVSLTVKSRIGSEFIWSKYSSLSKLLRVVSYCRRFLSLRVPKSERIFFPNFITLQELKDSLFLCVRQVQAYEFSEEIEQLKTRGCVSTKSNLRTVCPFIDDKEILRVGGRIVQSDAAYDTKHPIIMPASNHFSKLLIVDAHYRTLHGGPQIMLNFLRSKYWILRGKSQVKKVFRDCVICRRYNSNNVNNQLMGQLPSVRLKPSKPFKSTGVDYAGPINIRFSPGRGAKLYKGYICLFICMVTRAVHLEAVTDLSSKGFIAAFRRFVARRGHCQDLYCDNGTNFVGADKLLREMFNSYKSSIPAEIAASLTIEGTTFHFIPPCAPNFGGLWESGVRSTKRHLLKVIGTHTLTYEEMSTILTQVEACLNSRPISVLDDNPNDPLPLTPGHFLIGEPIINLADENCSNVNITGLDRWRLTQKIVRDFWNRWYKEYLVGLNQRYKWNTKRSEPKVGDIVILKEDNVPPAKWLLGKIVSTFSGPDNLIRVVTVKSKHGVYKRPISKISILCSTTEGSG